jgi:hypothetical protein
MKIFLFLWTIVSIFLLNGCVNVSSTEPNRSYDCTQKLDKFKKYQECMNNYILRVQECSYFYRSGEDIIRNTQVNKCIKEMYPDGRESCEP